MMKSMHLRAGAAALAAGVLLAGCSSDPEYPEPKTAKTTAPAPAEGAQAEGAQTAATPPEGATEGDGSFPDVNTVPTERPTTSIQDLNQAPEGLSGAESGTQYGEELVGGPTSNADRPPPPPEPSADDLVPIPEPGITDTSEGGNSVSNDNTPVNAPAEESAAEPAAAPVAEAAPVPSAQGQGQVVDATVQSQPLAPMEGAAPQAAAQPVTPVGTPQQGSQPFQPEAQLALAPGSVQTQTYVQPQATAYGPNYAALAPENYGVQFSQPALPPYQGYNAQAMYRSPYASPPTNYGGATVVGQTVVGQAAVPAPGLAPYGQAYGMPYGGGQPVGLVYFRDGSARLSSDDRKVLKQIAEMHRYYGGVIRVVGHASMRTGSMDLQRHQQANQKISEARAEAVARQLAKYGVPREFIQTIAAGDTQPVYAEMMPTGEAANRRAEVYLSAY
jgi:outer membrane protein OmpA-like peptidoglycan-associated protein